MIVKPCSLRISLSFSRKAHVLVEDLLDCLLDSGELRSQLFAILRNDLQPRSSFFSKLGDFRFDSLLVDLEIRARFDFGELPLFSLQVFIDFRQFSCVVFQFAFDLVRALSMPRNSRISRSVFVLISRVISEMTSSSLLG